MRDSSKMIAMPRMGSSSRQSIQLFSSSGEALSSITVRTHSQNLL